MDENTKFVTGCGDCPFWATPGVDFGCCEHPDQELDRYDKSRPAFDTCPLKKGPIMVVLDT